jgi:hypothetical protein
MPERIRMRAFSHSCGGPLPKPRRLRRHELHAPSHDRRGYYAPSDLPKDAPIAAVDIDDPWPIREGAAERLTGLAPPPPKIRIVRSLRGDQIGRMHATPCTTTIVPGVRDAMGRRRGDYIHRR